LKLVGHLWLTAKLTKRELERVADMLAGIAGDMLKGEHRGGVTDIQIVEDECESSGS
jgi:hypothetical protein